MNKEMILPFKTHTIYITLDDNKIYKLNKDFSKEEVENIPYPSRQNPTLLMHKFQFEMAKFYLLNKSNPFKISVEIAQTYNKIGFLSDNELADFIEE